MPGFPKSGRQERRLNLGRVHDELWRQIGLQSTSLEGIKEKARGILRISVLILGLMIAGLGNLVWLVYGGGLGQAGAFTALPEWAIMIGVGYGVVGLFAIAHAIDRSMNALGAAGVHHPVVGHDFETNGRFDPRKVRRLASSLDDEFYMGAIKSCVQTLRSRQQEARRIAGETGRAQRLLRHGLLSASLGVLYSFTLVGMTRLFSALA